MDISDKFVYLVGPVVVAITFYIRYRWTKQDQKDKQDSIGKRAS
jgi:hypothetical protein